MSTIKELPFVYDPSNGTGRNFWHVKQPDNMIQGASLGRAYAIAYFEFKANNKSGSILCTILNDMIAAGPLGPIEKNFIFTISEAFEVAFKNPWYLDAIKYRKIS